MRTLNNKLIAFFNLLFVFWHRLGIVEGIIGGYDVKPTDKKYQVLIIMSTNNICSASILNDRFVISAAHCFLDTKTNKFKKITYMVTAGVTEAFAKNGIRIHVHRVYILASFILAENGTPQKPAKLTQVNSHDIAILELVDKLEMEKNKILMAVKLPTFSALYHKEKPIVSGFGFNTYVNESYAIHSKGVRLKSAVTEVIPLQTCAKTHIVFPNQLCSRVIPTDPKIPAGTCKGDSGGPLVINGNTLIGIVEDGSADCDERDNTAIYTKVDAYLEFIHLVLSGKKSKTIRSATFHVKNVPGPDGNLRVERVLQEDQKSIFG